MKKFAILTSVLALAACGGGSGGHNGAVSGNNTATYVDPVRTSNAEVTGMVSNSKYQIARYVANKLGDDASSVNLSRTATHRAAFVPRASTGDVDYDTARELVDLAEWLAQDTTTRDEIIEKFNESKNKIKAALKLMDNMYCFVGGSAEKTADRILSRRESFQAPLAELKQNTEEFDLNNVIFSFADEGFDGKLKFVMDENNTGEITAINLLPDEEDLAEDPNDPGLVFERVDKTHGFSGQVNTEQGWVDGVLTYNSLGKDMKLKYADFGYFDIDVVDNWRPVFAGGYDNKKIPTNDITTSTTFSGRAVGSVMARRTHLGEMYEDQTQLPLDAPATLVFDKENNKTTRLTANFANWYDIVYTENDVNGKSITFSNYTDTPLATKKIVDGHETDENITINNYYKLESDNGPSFVIDNSTQLHNDHDEYFDPVESAISYFGDNNIATEAAGLIQVNDCQGGECNDANNVLRMNLTFGAKK